MPPSPPGLLVEISTIDLSPQSALQPLFVVPENAASPRLNVKDNACGAVARLIICNASAIPPRRCCHLHRCAALKNDVLENGPVFRALLLLFQTNGAALYPFVDRLLPAFAHVLDPKNAEQVSEEVCGELIHLLELIDRRGAR